MYITHKRILETFTLVELVLVIAIIAVLAGVMTPIIQKSTEDAKVITIVQLVENLSAACRREFADTGIRAMELCNKPLTIPTTHSLSLNPNYQGWNGPYISKPLSPGSGHNPYGNYTYVHADDFLFDLDGDGVIDVVQRVNYLWLPEVPEIPARKVNNILDKGIPGNWKKTGKIQFKSGGAGNVDALTIYLFHDPPNP